MIVSHIFQNESTVFVQPQMVGPCDQYISYYWYGAECAVILPLNDVSRETNWDTRGRRAALKNGSCHSRRG